MKKKQNKPWVATPIRPPDEFDLHTGVPPLYRCARNKDIAYHAF
jgi:hypothetical protein